MYFPVGAPPHIPVSRTTPALSVVKTPSCHPALEGSASEFPGVCLRDASVVRWMFLLLLATHSSYFNRVDRSLINLFNSLEKYFLLRGSRRRLKPMLQKNKSPGSQYSIGHLVSGEGVRAGLKRKRLTKDVMAIIALNLPGSFEKKTNRNAHTCEM